MPETGKSLVREVTNPSWGCEELGWLHGELADDTIGIGESRKGVLCIWEPQALQDIGQSEVCVYEGGEGWHRRRNRK